MTKRLEYIDIMRGIAILLVVFEHCIGSLKNPTAGIILFFHMPLFFFISGSCIKSTGVGKSLYIKKLKTILFPQVTLGIICIATTILFDVIIKRTIGITQVDYITPFGNWFLPTLFFMEMVMLPIIFNVRDRKFIGLIALLFFVVFYFTSYTGIQYVQQTLAALVFGLLGYMARPWLDKYNESTNKYKGMGWLALLFVALLSTYNDPVGMYINQYGNKLMFLLTSLIGIYAILDISVSLRNTTFLQWCGQVSIIIYILQFFLVRVGMVVSTYLTRGTNHWGYIITFFIVMLLIVPMTKVCSNYFPFLFGKAKQR